MADLTRVDLHGALEGKYIVVDDDQITFGVLEALESSSIGKSLIPLTQIIVESDLPHGHDQDGIRALTRKQSRALFEGVGAYLAIPKS